MSNLVRLLLVGGLVAFAVVVIAVGLARHDVALLGPVKLILFVIGMAFYLLPTMLALYRDSQATLWIALVNVVLGWTVFGWVVALGWAAGGKTRTLPSPIAAPPREALSRH